MNIWKCKIYALMIMSIFSVVHAAETAQKQLGPRADIVFEKRLLENSAIDMFICTGNVVQDMPVIGECPPVPGYVAIGFPECTQKSSIPRKLTVREISNGFVRLICELDYANATPIEAPVCDYSRCQYIAEPTLP
ncbi:MAG: hypothetical protein AMJ53_05045 [Gammaproteobacteria bacterium SG8_11]|nr:MAG: hypothetical protein AMJ53_05045 [Gammaproteobacteria bacterium SG8_11]